MTKNHIRFNTNFFSDDAVKILWATEDGDRYIVAYIKLLCKSQDGEPGYRQLVNKFLTVVTHEQYLSVLTDIPQNDICNFISALVGVGLLDIKAGRNIIRLRDINATLERVRCSSEYIMWRNGVFKRDNYTCQVCGERGRELNAHHVEPWSVCVEKRFELRNGMTVCRPCHKSLHGKRTS